METKQTAVKWLVEKLNQCEPMYSGIKSVEHKQYLDQLVELAKQMEKEQIEDAHIDGQQVFDNHPHTQWNNEQAEQYYNEKYNNC